MCIIFITYNCFTCVLQLFQKELAHVKWAAVFAANFFREYICSQFKPFKPHMYHLYILLFFFQIPLYTTLMTVLLVEHPGADVAVAVRVCVLAVVGVFRCRDLNFFLLILTSAPTCHTAKRKKTSTTWTWSFLWEIIFLRGFCCQENRPHASSRWQRAPCHAGMPSQRWFPIHTQLGPYLHKRAELLHQFNVCHKF